MCIIEARQIKGLGKGGILGALLESCGNLLPKLYVEGSIPFARSILLF